MVTLSRAHAVVLQNCQAEGDVFDKQTLQASHFRRQYGVVPWSWEEKDRLNYLQTSPKRLC
jgi:hypothetical protein